MHTALPRVHDWRSTRLPLTWMVIFALGIALSGAPKASGHTASEGLRQKVLAYAQEHLGQKVGNGQCAGLAVQALQAAGARPWGGIGYPAPRDYVWGQQVLLLEGTPQGPRSTGSLQEVHPGDIAQFCNAKIARARFAHHTAIVASIDAQHLGLLHQNVNGRKIVFLGAVSLNQLAEGWIRFYRPLPQP